MSCSVAVSAGLLSVGQVSLRAATMRPLLMPEGVGKFSTGVVSAISSDGSTVVGGAADFSSGGEDAPVRAVKWSVGGIQGEYLPAFPGMGPKDNSLPSGVSGNGSLIVGHFFVDGSQHGFKLENEKIVDYGASTNAVSVSKDGTVVVGVKDHKAVIWLNGSKDATVLPISPNSEFPGLVQTQLTGVSGNGEIVVGGVKEISGSGNTKSFKYNRTSKIYDEISVNNGSVLVKALSSNGLVCVGSTYEGNVDPFGGRAFKHMDGTIRDLGVLPGHTNSDARAVSGDGSVVVGTSWKDTIEKARAVKFSNGLIVDLGAFGSKPANVSMASGVSEDGAIIVGTAQDDTGMLRPFVYSNQGGTIVDPNVWMLSVTGVNSVVSISANLSTLPLEGAHHRPLMSFNTNGNPNAVWATGDAGFDNSPRGREVLAEMGFSRGVTEDLVVGFSVGRGQNRRDLAPVGRTTVTGNYLLGEIDYRLPYDGILSATGVLGDWQHDTRRGYLIAGGYDYSSGKGDIASRGIRARLDAPKIKLSENFELIPFASYTWMYAKSDAFSENSGSYPASFDSQSHMSKEGQLGLVAAVSLSNKTKIRLSGQVIRRFDREVTSVSGSWLNGAANFSVNNSAPIRDQGRTGIDVDHLIAKDTTLSLSSFYAGSGSRSSLMTSTSVRFSF